MLESEIVECMACPLRMTCIGPITPTSSWENIELMVVTDRPTIDEDKCQWGWGSRENRYTKSLIEKVWQEESIHYTYLTKCFSQNQAALGKKNTAKCRELFLEKEISTLKPKRILYLGSNCAKIMKGQFCQVQGNVGFWQSPFYILNGSKTYEMEFIKFLNQLKGIL